MPISRDMNDYLAVVSWYNDILGILNAMNDDAFSKSDIQASLTKLAGEIHKDIKETIVV